MNHAAPYRPPAARARQPSAAVTLPSWLRVPLMDCRLYAANLLDLFQDLAARIYEAGGITAPVQVFPTDTVGEAFKLTEKNVAMALVRSDADGQESVLLRLLRNIALQQGQSAEDADWLVGAVSAQFNRTDLHTFDDIADAMEATMQLPALALPQDQIDQTIGLLRSVGMLMAKLLALQFPLLSRARIDVGRNPETWVELSGSYTVTFPAKASELLQMAIEDDVLRIKVRLEAATLDGASTAEFFKIKETKKGDKTVTPFVANIGVNAAENALGEFFFGGITLTLTFDDKLDPAAVYPWAPGHDVRRAAWTDLSTSLALDEVRLQVRSTFMAVLAAYFEGNWGDVEALEEDLEQMIEDEVEGSADLFGMAGRLAEVVAPVAQRLVPVAHALSRVRYGRPFEGLLFDESPLPRRRGARGLDVAAQDWNPAFDAEFDGLHTYWKGRCAQVRNVQPEGPELENVPYDNPELKWPDNLEEHDPGPFDWAWPASHGGGLVRLELTRADHRARAFDLLARTSGLDARTRAIAALAVEGMSPREIGVLQTEAIDTKGKRVLGRPVQAQTLTWLKQAQKALRPATKGKAAAAPPFVFKDTAFNGRADQVSDLLRLAQRRVLALAQPPRPDSQPLDWSPPFSPDIWSTTYDTESPLSSAHGGADDPCWYALSTNCVLPTLLYRQLLLLGEFNGEGSTKVDGVTLVWQVTGGRDAAADFTGAAASGAPALALAQLQVRLGPNAESQIDYRADLRVRLKPAFHGHGCIGDTDVTVIHEALDCLAGMFGADMPQTTRLRQLEFRDVMVLAPDITDAVRDVQIVALTRADGQALAGADEAAVKSQLRGMVKPWLGAAPEPPILYNPFRPLGGRDAHFFAQGGWLCLNRQYDFPDFSGL